MSSHSLADHAKEKGVLSELHLVDAFSSNDFPSITAHISTKATFHSSYGSPLHLAVSLSNKHTVEGLIEYWAIDVLEWINMKNPTLETPLHLTAKLGRSELVDAMFKIKSVDDTIRDNFGRVPHEVAKNDKVADLFRGFQNALLTHPVKKQEFTDEVYKYLRSSVNDPHGGKAIIDYFKDNIRANEYLKLGWIDINAPIDPVTEQGLLHYASKNEDEPLMQWVLSQGGDANVKDKKGKLPSALLKKESKLKGALKHGTNTVVFIGPGDIFKSWCSIGPAAFADYAGKYSKTNYAVGYKSRFFVLENGILSYYKSESEYPLSCRGSISTLIADVELPDSQDRSRFDVISKGSISYSLKARSPADAKKWVWAIKESKTWMIDHAKLGSSMKMIQAAAADDEDSSDNDQFEKSLSARESHEDGLNLKRSMDVQGTGSHYSINSTVGWADDRRQSADEHTKPVDNDMPATLTEDLPTLLYLLDVQLDVQQRVIDGVIERMGSTGIADDEEYDMKRIPALIQSTRMQVHKTVSKIILVAETRERKWQNKWKRERQSKIRWENIVKNVMEGNEDIVLAAAGRKLAGNGVAEGALAPSTASGLPETVVVIGGDTDDDVFYDAHESSRFSAEENRSTLLEQSFGFQPTKRQSIVRFPSPNQKNADNTSIALINTTTQSIVDSFLGYSHTVRKVLPLDPKKSAKPSLNVWSFLKSAIGKDLSKVTLPVFFNEPLSMLQRMCEDVEYIELLSLAARVGAPALIKEASDTHPASTAAARERQWDLKEIESLEGDEASLMRLMLVAAYAMSNYSSTVGRTSKPFNPMLGETFELVNRILPLSLIHIEEKQYRYISEQVCHHPPISACHCESPDFEFWTEVNVKSRFWGKSLEVHPMGVCHVRIPVNDSPEHFSWRKVTTNVNNLIVGTLWIDHYGDMVVKNWKTGEEATLSFKPKSTGGWFGWSGSGVKEKERDVNSAEDVNSGGHIIGKVKDVNGVVRFEIKGKWDSDLTAYSVTPMQSPFLNKPITLWRRNVMPDDSAANFDFSKLAVSMNELPASLSKFLPKTDARLRPDQRALEEGKWTEANEFKETLERRQREERKAIMKRYEENGVSSGPPNRTGISIGEEWWIPRWFMRQIDDDTQEEYWKFTGDYWGHRKQMALHQTPWPDWVPDLFTSNSKSPQ